MLDSTNSRYDTIELAKQILKLSYDPPFDLNNVFRNHECIPV